jgi:hypothetical protein
MGKGGISKNGQAIAPPAHWAAKNNNNNNNKEG